MRSLLLWLMAVSAAIGLGMLAVYLPIVLETGSFHLPRKWPGDDFPWPLLCLLLVGELLLGFGFSRLPFLWGLQPLLLTIAAVVPILVVYDNILQAAMRADPQANILWPIAEFFLGVITFVPAAVGAYAGRGLAWIWKRKGRGNVHALRGGISVQSVTSAAKGGKAK